MNRPEDVRDQMRELKYLQEEDKLLKDILRRVEDQKNRLKVEELTLKKIAKDKNPSLSSPYFVDDNEIFNQDFFTAATPSLPMSITMDNQFYNYSIDDSQSQSEPNVAAETLELDVSKILLKMACGESKKSNQEEFEEEFDDEECEK